jgi:hypothetical protein
MKRKFLIAIALLAFGATAVPAAEIPRKSTEFAIQMPAGKQVLLSEFRGKVLCLVFILTT